MIQVTVLGFIFIFFNSLGGSNEVENRLYRVCLHGLGLIAVVVSTVVPYFVVSRIRCTVKAQIPLIRYLPLTREITAC